MSITDKIDKYLINERKINRKQAYKEDMEYAKKYNENPFYIEEEDGTEYIFGLSSGFAYSSPMRPEKEVKKMWKEMKNKLDI